MWAAPSGTVLPMVAIVEELVRLVIAGRSFLNRLLDLRDGGFLNFEARGAPLREHRHRAEQHCDRQRYAYERSLVH
jgi:hypothetical protein